MTPNDLISHIGPIGQFLVGLAALLTLFAGFWKTLGSVKKDLVEATTHWAQQFIQKTLEDEADRHHPSSFYTLEIEFEGGHRMAVPMFRGKEMMVAENITMAVQDHNAEYTELGLWCKGFGVLGKHRHRNSCETVHVERGTVTHLETGMVYRAGETMVLDKESWHSAMFHDCYCRVIHRPPLPTAAVQPVDLSAMKKVFPQ